MGARLHRFVAASIVAGCFASAVGARAQVPLVDGLGGVAGFGTACLSPNDDGSSDPIDLSTAFPTGLRFFSGDYDRVVVNTNGNVTFNGALPVYTPAPFPVANQPMVAPYWSDVDIRPFVDGCGGFGASTGSPGNAPCMSPSSNGVWWHLEPGLFIVTWHEVGYFSCHGDHRMSFQLILTDTSSCASPGDFDAEFRFNRCEWTTGDASGGSGGFGGTPAQSGFDAGDGTHFFAVPGSLMPDINVRMCTGSNTGTPGVWRFSIRNGEVTMGGGGTQMCGLGLCRVVVPRCMDNEPLSCTPGRPEPEQCDGMDHDCNGVPNDGEISCGVGACRRTVPLCTGNTRTACVPGEPRPEACDNVDSNCNGTVNDCCGVAAGADGGCRPWIRLQGRAGPYGDCQCSAIGTRDVPSEHAGAWLLSMAAAFAVARRKRRSASPRR